MFKAGYVAIVGLPNAGKSSLVNTLVGEKVAIISSKPQTTRENIIGIVNGEDYQIILVDTPGVHHSKNALDKVMMKNVKVQFLELTSLFICLMVRNNRTKKKLNTLTICQNLKL